jgi:insulysin
MSTAGTLSLLCAICAILFARAYLGRGRLHSPSLYASSISKRAMLLSSVAANELEKPQIDDRLFHQFTLSNGIKATVVQDKTSEKASGSLSVRTGAANDPLPGIAHITEHAVFLGSVKYPLENAYKDFLNKNGGGSNAATGMEQTTYKFNINADAFPHALDIFSQFFKGPLLSTEAISREVMAVDGKCSPPRA